MPDELPRLAFRVRKSSGQWHGQLIHGEVTLFLEQDEVVLRQELSGVELASSVTRLRGAAWRAGVLSLHVANEALELSDGESLDRAWHELSRRACTLPEVARSLRSLGGEGGDYGGARERFFSPLLQARRRLESDQPVDWRVAEFDVVALSERVRAALAAMAMERHAERPSHRRALEATLLDACETMFGQLDRLGDVAHEVFESDDARRFDAWRAWAIELRSLFSHADVAWTEVRDALRLADGPRLAGFRR